MPSPTEQGSPVNVDDTSDAPISLLPSSDDSVCNSQKGNTEESDADYVLVGDSDINDDDSSSSDTNKKQRKFVVCEKKLISLFCTCKTPIYYTCIICQLPLQNIPLTTLCSDDMQLIDMF